MHSCYIGLGSNLDDPHGQLLRAFEALSRLPQSTLVARSPLYRSAPVGPPQPDYLNAVAHLDTHLKPLDLLDALQAIEQDHQRVRRQHWGPRTLDLDLLLYADQTLNTPRLTVPHPEMTRRAFVLYPLADIAPQLTLPTGTSLASLLTACPFEGLERLNPDSQHRES